MNKTEIMDGLKKGFKKYWWIIGIVLLVKILKPDLLFSINLQTQSIFGGIFGLILPLGLIMIIVGIGLAMTIPLGNPWGVVGPPIAIGGWILLGGSAIQLFINALKNPYIIGFMVFIVIFFMLKRK